jgi:hypothetical protein
VGFKESNIIRFVGKGSELCWKKTLWQDCGRTGKGGVVKAFVRVYSSVGHVPMMARGCVKLRVWFAE